jgi:hypothetical protein
VEGIRNILEMIGIPMDKIIDFFKKALGLDSAARINAALKSIVALSLDILVDKASEMKETSVQALSDAIDEIEKWTGFDENSLSEISLPDTAASGNSLLSDMGISLNSHNMYLYDLMKNALSEEISLTGITMPESMETAIRTLSDNIKDIETDVEKLPASLVYLADEIEGLFRDFTVSHFLSVAKKILGIAAEGLLNISRTILTTIFDIVIEGIRAIWQALNSPIQIPFLSGVLGTFGINEVALVDLVTYPLAFLAGAINGTARLVSGKEMFDVETLEVLAKAESMSELKQIGGVSYE